MTDPRVEPDRRLVEEQDTGGGDERPGDLEPPALAAAVARHRPVDQLGETEGVDELVDARLAWAG